MKSEPSNLPAGVTIRQALPSDAAAIHGLMRPYVANRLLLDRSEAEIIELTRHGFIASLAKADGKQAVDGKQAADGTQMAEQCVGFSAVEIYSSKLAELQCLAVHHDYQKVGVGRELVAKCVARARELNVMEIMAISSSEDFFQGCGFDYSLPDQRKAFFSQLRPRHPE